MMNEQGKSDRPAVPAKSPNNAARAVAEGMEGRGLTEGNLSEQNALRMQSRESVRSALERVRQEAKKDRTMRFSALLHHAAEKLHVEVRDRKFLCPRAAKSEWFGANYEPAIRATFDMDQANFCPSRIV